MLSGPQNDPSAKPEMEVVVMNPKLPALAVVAAALGLMPVPARGADVLQTHRLSAALATEIAVAAIAACTKLGYTITASVVDADGVHQVLIRGDGAGIHTVQTAQDKAFAP